MIPYAVYKLIHYLGIFSLVTALAATLARAAPRATAGRSDTWRRPLLAAHGSALFLILLGGFGMLARLGVTHGLTLPGWILGKLGIWLLLGGLVLLARRWPERSGAVIVIVPILAVLAGVLAFTKPF